MIDVERYIHVNTSIAPLVGNVALEAYPTVNQKTARFKVISPVNLRGRELTTSNWLPKEQIRPKKESTNGCLPGEPYFIRPVKCHVNGHKRCLSMTKNKIKGAHEEGSCTCNESNFKIDLQRKSRESSLMHHVMLFVLEKGHST